MGTVSVWKMEGSREDGVPAAQQCMCLRPLDWTLNSGLWGRFLFCVFYRNLKPFL